MKLAFAIVKIDKSGDETIISFIESFEKLVAHLKMMYSETATFIEKREERDIRKNTAYPSGQKYILLNKPIAVLYEKEDQDNSGFVFSGTVTKMNLLCSWKLIKLDLAPECEYTSEKTVELRNFKLKNYKYGSISLIHSDYTKDINTILATILSRVDVTSQSNSVVVSKKISGNALENINVIKSYDTEIINSNINKPHKKIIFVDTGVGLTEENYSHLFSIMRNAKTSHTLVVIAVECSTDLEDVINNSDQLMLLSNVSMSALNNAYSKLKISHLFSTTVLFSSIFKQLTDKFGVMIISREDEPTGTVSWYRL